MWKDTQNVHFYLLGNNQVFLDFILTMENVKKNQNKFLYSKEGCSRFEVEHNTYHVTYFTSQIKIISNSIKKWSFRKSYRIFVLLSSTFLVVMTQNVNILKPILLQLGHFGDQK